MHWRYHRFLTPSSLKFALLGPLEIAADGQQLPLKAAKQKTVMALLLLHRDEVVSVDRLREALWGERPPATAATALQGYVSQLRRVLEAGEKGGASLLLTRSPGYSLTAAPDQLDLALFERLAQSGREALAADESARAAALLAEALTLWRGPPLADFAYEAWAQAAIGRLEELRLSALEDRVEADLACGRHGELVGELESLVAEQPLRERLRGQLMLALYRAGRQAEALESYQVARRTLVDELGIEPSSELQSLNHSILNQDEALAAPQRAAASRPIKLPVPPTPLVGRERELEELVELLTATGVRLVTVTGPGGIGKTRVAVELARSVADRYPDGVWFVDLSLLRDPALLEPTIAQTLQAKDPQPLAEHLVNKQMLLVLDNFEQLLDAAEILAALLEQAPSLKLLATSRACLRLAAEREYPLPPLIDDKALELFVVRARAAKPTFEPDENVPQICSRVDNLPLALELAAARIRVLTPEAILARLGRRLPLLTSGTRDAPERQRTLRATIDWSYDLLDEGEQEVFSRLAVFAGSFDLEAATRISGAGIDPIQGLVEKSLLRQTPDGRFFMLETVREYAEEVLAAGNDDRREVHRRHAAHYLRLAKEIDEPIRNGPDIVALERMRLVQGNCRAALEFLLRSEDTAGALRLVTALGYFWYVTGQLQEASAWFERVLDLPNRGPQVARAHALNTAAGIAMHSGDAVAARTYTEQALAVWRELGETEAVVRSLNELGNAAIRENRLAAALKFLQEALALAKTIDDPLWAVLLQSNTGEAKLFDGHIAEAREHYEAALKDARAHDYSAGIGWSLLGLASVQLAEQQRSAAEESLREALSLADELGFMDLIGGCLDVAAGLAGAAADANRAGWFLGAAGAVDSTTGSSRRLPPILDQHVGAAREQLGRARFESARRDGSSATVQEAVAATHDYLV